MWILTIFKLHLRLCYQMLGDLISERGCTHQIRDPREAFSQANLKSLGWKVHIPMMCFEW
jgi:hypothetical protein